MIFAPRSCPSSPGFATTTLIFPLPRFGQYRNVKLTVVGCSPAWPNPGGAQSGYLIEAEGPAPPRLRARRAAAPAQHWRAGRRSTRSRSRTSTSIIGATSCRGCGAPQFGPASELPRPSCGCRPVAEGASRSSARSSGAPTCSRRAFDVHEYADGEAFEAAGSRVTRDARPALRDARLRLSCLGQRHDAGVLGRQRPERRAAGSRTRRRRSSSARRRCSRRTPRAVHAAISRPRKRGRVQRSGAKRLLLTHRPAERPLENGYEQAYDGFELDL